MENLTTKTVSSERIRIMYDCYVLKKGAISEFRAKSNCVQDLSLFLPVR